MNIDEQIKGAQQLADRAAETAKDASDKLAELREQLAKQPTEPLPEALWEAKVGEYYYFILADGEVHANLVSNFPTAGNLRCKARGNYYRTRELAEQAPAKQEAEQAIIHRIAELDYECDAPAVDWNNVFQKKHRVILSHHCRRLLRGTRYHSQDAHTKFYSTNVEVINTVLKELEAEYLLILGAKPCQ